MIPQNMLEFLIEQFLGDNDEWEEYVATNYPELDSEDKEILEDELGVIIHNRQAVVSRLMEDKPKKGIVVKVPTVGVFKGYENKDTIGQYSQMSIFDRKYELLLEKSRVKAMQYIDRTCNGLEPEHMFSHIWFASINILPKLEVQVVIDSNDKLHISTGSSGYVDFRTNPIGIKLPIKCWIHTHPFGSAYFSGVDWKTVNTWQPLMLEAYVLGGENHYGHWNNNNPHKLIIIEKDGNIRVQEQQLRLVKGEERGTLRLVRGEEE